MARQHLPFNGLKRQALIFFSARQWTHPNVYAAGVGMFPIRASYTYLKHLQRMGLLLRGRDVRGRLVYRLSQRGASWLIWDRKKQRV